MDLVLRPGKCLQEYLITSLYLQILIRIKIADISEITKADDVPELFIILHVGAYGSLFIYVGIEIDEKPAEIFRNAIEEPYFIMWLCKSIGKIRYSA